VAEHEAAVERRGPLGVVEASVRAARLAAGERGRDQRAADSEEVRVLERRGPHGRELRRRTGEAIVIAQDPGVAGQHALELLARGPAAEFRGEDGPVDPRRDPSHRPGRVGAVLAPSDRLDDP